MARFLVARPTAPQMDLGLLVVRIALGAILIAHGAQKVFSFGLAGVTGAMTQMGAPAPAIVAPLVMAAELLGGIAILLGFLTRIAAIGNIVVQLGAIVLVHLAGGFFLPKGYEFNLALVGMALALAIAGAGRWSVDEALSARSRP